MADTGARLEQVEANCTVRAEPASRWFALHTRSRHEKRVADQLEDRCVESFLPVYEEIHRWKNHQQKKIRLPLFPGYVFVRCSSAERLRVLQVPGAVRLIGFGGTPEPLPDSEIEALRVGSSRSIPMEPFPYMAEGCRVRLKSGALEGLEGMIVRRKGLLRAVLSIHLIHRSVLLDAELAELELLPAVSST